MENELNHKTTLLLVASEYMSLMMLCNIDYLLNIIK